MKPTQPTQPLAATDTAAKQSLIEMAGVDAFAPMRWLDRFGAEVSVRHRSDQIREALRSAPRPLVVREGGEALGGLIWREVPDLAEHFDVPVREAVAVLVKPGVDRRPVVADLLGALTSEGAGNEGLVMLRIEADDRAGLAGATDSGFRLFETSLSFVNDLERRHLNPPYDATGMRVHCFDDGPVPDKMRSVLSSAPTRVVDDHYHADPRLDDERCDALYDRLRDRVIQGVGADVLVYHEIDGVITGFGTFKRAADLAPYDIALLDGSIGFQFPGAPPGQSSASAAFMCNEPLLENRFVEWGTQATNYRMVNMLAGRRSIRLCRTSYMLHCWTDEL
ncbi:MAG: hypothetical protein R3E12_20615 [Candidatus Eisenbacteria bacterium]